MWEWMRNAGRAEKEKIQRMNALEDLKNRDQAALRKLSEGQEVETPDGWTGRLLEKHPERGEVYVETWDKSGTYHASRVRPAGGSNITGEL